MFTVFFFFFQYFLRPDFLGKEQNGSFPKKFNARPEIFRELTVCGIFLEEVLKGDIRLSDIFKERTALPMKKSRQGLKRPVFFRE